MNIQNDKNILFLDSVLNLIADPVFVKDGDFQFVYVNDALCQMLGMDRENIIGKTLGESLPQDQMKHFLEIDTLVLDSGQGNMSEELLTGKDGKILTIITKKTRYVDEKGNKFVVGIIHDNTERKRAEEKIELFKNATDSSSDAVGMSTPEGKHYYQNKTFIEMFGDIGNDPPGSVYVDEKVGREIFQTIMAGGTWNGEVEMYGKGRNVLNILLRAYPIKDNNSKVLGLVGIHTNITERKKAEENLKKKVDELENMNKLMIGRELKMVELKKEIEVLKKPSL